MTADCAAFVDFCTQYLQQTVPLLLIFVHNKYPITKLKKHTTMQTPTKDTTAPSQPEEVSPGPILLTPTTTDSTPLVQKSNETLRAENVRLTMEIQKLHFSLNEDIQQEQIKPLTKTNELNEEKIENLEEQVELCEQMIIYEKSNSSRKGRVKQVNEAKKIDMKSIRDVITSSVSPRCKFLHKKQIRCMSGLSNTIMNKLVVEKEHRILWWATHHEVVEMLLVEHRTKAAQRMKVSFKQGKYKDVFCFSIFIDT